MQCRLACLRGAAQSAKLAEACVSQSTGVLFRRLSYGWDVRSIAVGLGAGGAALAVNNGLQALLGQAGEQPGATGTSRPGSPPRSHSHSH